MPDLGAAGKTNRQRLVELLSREELSFEALRDELAFANNALESCELRTKRRRVRSERHTVVVDRQLVDAHAADLENLSHLARVLLHRDDDGVVDGFQLSGIRRDTLFDQLGLRNGDVINSVAGTELTDVASAIRMWDDIESTSRVELDITRRGEPLTIVVEIADLG